MNVERFFGAIHGRRRDGGDTEPCISQSRPLATKNCGSVRGNRHDLCFVYSAEQRRQSVGNKTTFAKECISGKTDKSPRNEFWYVNDDGQVVAARWGDWKVVLLENRGEAFGVWREPFTELRVPLLFNLRRDPFEKSQHNSNSYNDWFLDRPFVIVPIQALAAQFLQTMKDYPPSQTPGSFNLSKTEEALRNAH